MRQLTYDPSVTNDQTVFTTLLRCSTHPQPIKPNWVSFDYKIFEQIANRNASYERDQALLDPATVKSIAKGVKPPPYFGRSPLYAYTRLTPMPVPVPVPKPPISRDLVSHLRWLQTIPYLLPQPALYDNLWKGLDCGRVDLILHGYCDGSRYRCEFVDRVKAKYALENCMKRLPNWIWWLAAPEPVTYSFPDVSGV